MAHPRLGEMHLSLEETPWPAYNHDVAPAAHVHRACGATREASERTGVGPWRLALTEPAPSALRAQHADHGAARHGLTERALARFGQDADLVHRAGCEGHARRAIASWACTQTRPCTAQAYVRCGPPHCPALHTPSLIDHHRPVPLAQQAIPAPRPPHPALGRRPGQARAAQWCSCTCA